MKSELMRDDMALDVRDKLLEELCCRFEAELQSAHCDRSDLRWLMAHSEIIYAIAAFCGNNGFGVRDVQKWKTRALSLFDEDERGTSESVAKWRRQIEASFDRLADVATKDSEPAP